MGEITRVGAVDDGPGCIDELMRCIILHQCHRHTFFKDDIDGAGKASLDDNISDPANVTDAAVKRVQIDAENGRVKLQVKGAKQGFFLDMRAAPHLNMAQFQADLGTKLMQFADHPRTINIEHAAGADQPEPKRRKRDHLDPMPPICLRLLCCPLWRDPADQSSHCAISNRWLTSSSPDMPRNLACSGTSDVAVMPGWVLTSSMNN